MKSPNILRTLLIITVITLISSTAWAPASGQQGADITRIRFERGATSGTVDGELAAHSKARYVLRAGAGQLMDVTLSAPEGTTIKATTTGGRVLTPVEDTGGATGFRGYLPYTGDYYLTVTSGSQAVDYTVNVSIPVRVRFDRGMTSDQVEADLNAHQSLDYILRAGKGQILEINATPDDDVAPLQLIIYGVDGTVLRSGMGEGSTFRGELPSSQDYLVHVRAGDRATDFSMDVIIPQVIRFKTGAYSGSVRTYLPAERTQYYSLRAMEDQTMEVEITNDDDLQLVIYGVDGKVLKSGTDAGASFKDELPSTQEYILAVTNDGEAVSYTLRVTIR